MHNTSFKKPHTYNWITVNEWFLHFKGRSGFSVRVYFLSLWLSQASLQGSRRLVEGGGATVNKLTIMPLFSACWVSSCFHNPPNSDMDYRIFYVRTFLCVRLHTGVGHNRRPTMNYVYPLQVSLGQRQIKCAWRHLDWPINDWEGGLWPRFSTRHIKHWSLSVLTKFTTIVFSLSSMITLHFKHFMLQKGVFRWCKIRRYPQHSGWRQFVLLL